MTTMFDQEDHESRAALALRWLCGLFLALVAPFGLLALLIGPPDFDADPDRFRIPWYLVWVGLVVPGVLGIHLMPIKKSWKGILTTFYVPACLVATAFFTFWYACKYYGGCL